MPEHEYYRLDLVVDTKGDEQTKEKLRATDRFIEHTRKRGEMLNRMKVSPTVKLIDRISAPLRTIENKLGRLSRTVTHTAGSMVRALTSPLGLLGAAGGTWGAVAFPLKLSGEMEQANIAFETMLGSADKAKSFMKELTTFAIKTPFEMPQLRTATQMLMAYGFKAEQIIPTLTAVGGAAAGLGMGAEGINQISNAMGQIKVAGRLMSRDLLQLTMAGIPAWQILSEKMGVSQKKLMSMVERGIIPADKAIDILIKGMNERFPGMLERQSRSLFGLVSTIKDAFNLGLLVRWGDGLSKAVKPRLEKLVDLFTKNEAVTKRWGDVLEKTAFRAGDAIMTWFERTFDMIDRRMKNPAFERLDWAGKLTAILGNIAADVVPKATVVGIQIGIGLAKGIAQGFLEAVRGDKKTAAILGPLVGLMTPGPLPVKLAAAAAITATPFALETGEKVGERLPGSELYVSKKIAEQQKAWEQFKKKTPGKVMFEGTSFRPYDPFEKDKRVLELSKEIYLGGKWRELKWQELFGLKAHAFGTIATRPHLGLVAEDGPEAIIPLSPKRRQRALSLWQQTGDYLTAGAGGGAINVNVSNITVNLAGNEIDEEELVSRIGGPIAHEIMKTLENRG